MKFVELMIEWFDGEDDGSKDGLRMRLMSMD